MTATDAHGVTSHSACYVTRTDPAISAQVAETPGFALGQRRRKRVEEIFGWLEMVGGLRRSRVRGLARTGQLGQWAAAHNLGRTAALSESSAITSAVGRGPTCDSGETWSRGEQASDQHPRNSRVHPAGAGSQRAPHPTFLAGVVPCGPDDRRSV